jgi:hypothetical protein
VKRKTGQGIDRQQFRGGARDPHEAESERKDKRHSGFHIE